MSNPSEATDPESRSLFDRHTLFIALFAAFAGIAVASLASVSGSLLPGDESAVAGVSLLVETVQGPTPVLVVRNPTDQITRMYSSLGVAASEIAQSAANAQPQATTFEIWFRDPARKNDADEPFPGLVRHVALTGHRQPDGSINVLDWERTVYSVPLSESHPAARVVLAQFIPELLDRNPRTPADWEPFQNRVKPILLRGNPRDVRSLFGTPDVAALAASAEFLRRVPAVLHLRVKVPLVAPGDEPESVMYECRRSGSGFELSRSVRQLGYIPAPEFESIFSDD